MVQFIEVTEDGGGPTVVGLRFIKLIRRDPRDGKAVLEFAEGPRMLCVETFEEVTMVLKVPIA